MPRSGSTSFRHWIDEAENGICHGEILGPGMVVGTSEKQKKWFSKIRRDHEPELFFDHYFGNHSEAAIGFKALSSHLLLSNNFVFLKQFFSHDPLVINLFRSDLVARFSSAHYHRLKSGLIDEYDILNLRPRDVLYDCIKSTEQWNISSSYWLKPYKFINIAIKDFTTTQREQISDGLRLNLNHPIKHKNSNAKKFAQEVFHEAVEHLEEICSGAELNPYRTISLGPQNLIKLAG